jgi:6-pyruvoyltetrahydropterin/6-carboxytetrahydropterin synthase
MHYLTRLVEFEASHRYWNPEFTPEQNHRTFGKCVSPYGHGHNYVLRVTLAGQVAAHTGMVINITELDRILKEVSAEFDHKFINLDHPAFHDRIPTTENLASYMRDRIEDTLRTQHNADYRLALVRLYEEPSLWSDVIGGEGKNMASLTKTFGFSAAHRLHSSALSEEENRAVFGKCNNPHGHGHNYELEVTVSGPIAPHTGMVMDLAELMKIVQDEVLDRFDHKHLNEDTPEFQTLNPTGENISRVIWDLLKPQLGERLTKVGVWETPKNFFEYHGEEGA